MVTIADVRNQLNDVSTDVISDAIVQQQISVASALVENERDVNADSSDVENAKLMYSTYLTYLTYTNEIERTTGAMPDTAALRLSELKELAEKFLSFITAGGYKEADKSTVLPVFDYFESPVRMDR